MNDPKLSENDYLMIYSIIIEPVYNMISTQDNSSNKKASWTSLNEISLSLKTNMKKHKLSCEDECCYCHKWLWIKKVSPLFEYDFDHNNDIIELLFFVENWLKKKIERTLLLNIHSETSLVVNYTQF